MSNYLGTIDNSISEKQFQEISSLVKKIAGINLHNGKRELVKARLSKRTRELKLHNLQEYINFVKHDKSGSEIIKMLDALSTNLTYFFRESQHFDFMCNNVLPGIISKGKRKLRIWSAGCSSGEEPYTIGMLLNETIPNLHNWDAKILATDLSTKVLRIASVGQYSAERFRETPKYLINQYFNKISSAGKPTFKVKPSVRNLISFARLNLMENWPMQGPMDMIFCRNVMIYFDKQTQAELLSRFYKLLAPGGFLFLGHSESLTGGGHNFRYCQPATYIK